MTWTFRRSRFVSLSWDSPTCRGFIIVWPLTYFVIGTTVRGRRYIGWPRLSGPWRWVKGVAYRLPVCTKCHRTILGSYEIVDGQSQHSTLSTLCQCPSEISR